MALAPEATLTNGHPQSGQLGSWRVLKKGVKPMAARRNGYLALVCLLLSLGVNAADDSQLGDIVFPNSGASEAQTAFLTGVKALHSFQFDEARIAF